MIATPRTRSSLTGHPDVQRRRDGYVTFGKGDLAALEELSTEDVVRHVAGRSELAGTHEGRTAVFEFFGNVMELTEGSFRVEPLTLLADDYGCAPVRITAHRGERHLEVMTLQASRLQDGRVAEFWGHDHRAGGGGRVLRLMVDDPQPTLTASTGHVASRRIRCAALPISSLPTGLRRRMPMTTSSTSAPRTTTC